jgi:hypothetical protein
MRAVASGAHLLLAHSFDAEEKGLRRQCTVCVQLLQAVGHFQHIKAGEEGRNGIQFGEALS